MEASNLKYQEQASKTEGFTYYRPHSQIFTPSTQPSTRVLPSENGEFDEQSGELQSVVVMDDFDVEKELHRAQKDGTNAFKVLSMCFYERTKARLANKRNTPVPELQRPQSPVHNVPLKTSSSPRGYAQLAQRSPRAIQVKMFASPQNVREAVDNKNLHSPKEHNKNTQPTKPQLVTQRSLKVGLTNNCGIPNDPLKSPKNRVAAKEAQTVKEEKPVAREKPALKLENENATYYFSILKQKYSSPQTHFGADYAEAPKPVPEETRRGTIDSSRSTGTPLTKLFDLKDQIRQLRDMKNAKPAVGPKTTRNMPQKELMINNFTDGHISKNYRDSSENSITKGMRGYVYGRGTVESPRMHTERTFDLATPVLTELHEEDSHFQMKKPGYQTKKTLEIKLKESGKKKSTKEKTNEVLSSRTMNSQVKNSESVRNLSRAGQNGVRKELEDKMKMKLSNDNSRGWIGEKRDNYNSSVLGKSSECKRFSIDPVEAQKSGGYAAKAKLRLNLDGLGKERCETEPDTLSLREYLSKSQKHGGSKTKR